MAEKPKLSRAAKSKAAQPPKRLNRVVGVADALVGALDPVLKKRGFASRDLVIHWGVIAPEPYNRVSLPEKLNWPRNQQGAEGAVLYVSCAQGHALALSHEGDKIAAAINRYFGYVLVGQVRLSATPFIAHSVEKPQSTPQPNPQTEARVSALVSGINDEGIKQALQKLGRAVMSKSGNSNKTR